MVMKIQKYLQDISNHCFLTPTVIDIDQFGDNFWGMPFMTTSKYKFSHQPPNVHALRALKERDWSKEYNSQGNS